MTWDTVTWTLGAVRSAQWGFGCEYSRRERWQTGLLSELFCWCVVPKWCDAYWRNGLYKTPHGTELPTAHAHARAMPQRTVGACANNKGKSWSVEQCGASNKLFVLDGIGWVQVDRCALPC